MELKDLLEINAVEDKELFSSLLCSNLPAAKAQH